HRRRHGLRAVRQPHERLLHGGSIRDVHRHRDGGRWLQRPSQPDRASVPSGVTTSCSPASVTPNGTSACAMTGTNVGSYAVTITGTSGALVHSAAVAVTIVAAGPTARFVHSPSMPYVNTTVTFDASSSSDSDPNATLQARWDWESDGTWDTSLSSSLIAQYAFAAAGSYTVTLQIQDSLGFSVTATQGIAVLDSGAGGGG